VDLHVDSKAGGFFCRRLKASDMRNQVTSGEADGDDGDDEESENLTALETALAEKYQSLVVQGHSESCLWFKAGCKDDIYRLQVVRPSIWQPELRKRFLTLLDIGDAITGVTIQAPEDGSARLLLDDLPNAIMSPEERSKPASKKALDLALCGWRGSVESGNQLLHCDACFQRIGLWMYQPEYIASHRRPDEAADGDEITISEDHSGLDIVELHREHCPWRSADSQCATGSLHGLNASQILQKIATTCARDHRRRSDDKSRHVAAAQDDERDDDHAPASERPAVSREEVARQDKERESRLRKLKNLFNIKRRAPKAATSKSAV
jgi:hypothetical protein